MSKTIIYVLSIYLLIALCSLISCTSKSGSSKSYPESQPVIQPAPPIPVFKANSENEINYLNTPFKGITSDGEVQQGLFSIKLTGIPVNEIQEAIAAFLSSLNKEQLESCTFPVEDNEWRRWHNIESYQREGIALFDLNEDQKKLAFDILEASMSEKGVTKARNIMLMEDYLKEVSAQVGNGNNMPLHLLGADKYWFSFMGTPDNEPWGWQIDGHHLVVNYFVLGDQVVMTPTFMGSELTHIEEGLHKGIRTFVEEGKKGLALLHALNKDQLEKAIVLNEKKYNYSRAEAFRDNEEIPYRGVSTKSFDGEQNELLLDLIEEYIGNMELGHADIKMQEVKHHLSETWFCWIGGTGENDVFYYQIYSPVLLIEYDHHNPVFIVKSGESASDPVNWHVHTVVRTPNGNDYGKDLLKQHIERHHSHDH